MCPAADWTKVGGASAGSLIAAVHQCGMDLDFVVEQCMRFMHELRAKGTRGRLGVSVGNVFVYFSRLGRLSVVLSVDIMFVVSTHSPIGCRISR